MAGKNTQKTSEIRQSFKQIIFWLNLISIQALLSIVWLLSIPKEAGNAVIFGFSFKRLALLIPLFLPIIGSMLQKRGLKRNAEKQSWFSDASKKSRLAVFLTLSGFLIAAIMLSTGFLYHFMAISVDINIYIRLLPILTCYFLLGVEAILFVPLVLFPSKRINGQVKNSFPWLPFCISFGILVFGLMIVTFTGFGINPVRVSIISLGSPLLEGQIWYITILLALMMTAAYAWKCIPEGSRPPLLLKLDLTIALALWLLAVVLWMSLPLPKNNYFAPQVQAPNFEKYPFSDAEQYDFNSLYVYYGTLKNFVISKPLYVSLLALFHAIAGLNYDRVIFLQTLLVAAFPSVLYLIGKELHSRMGGIAIALFAIMREVTAIQATSIANVSSTKLLLSDMPATLLASVLALMLIRWFKSSEKRVTGHEFIIGGLVGMFILMRIQTLALIPFVILAILIRYYRNFNTIFLSFIIFLVGIGFVVTPILLRNHAITGVYWVDNPSSSQSLYKRFISGSEREIDIPSASSQEEMLNRNFSVIFTTIEKNLPGVINFTAQNFIRNEISSTLIFPLRLGNKIFFLQNLRVDKPFWMEVYSKPNLLNLCVLLINFGFIALGFSVIYKRNTKSALILLAFHLVYNLSSAIVNLSGWRFILPVDWILFAFFAIGLVESVKWILIRKLGWNLDTHLAGLIQYPVKSSESHRSWIFYAKFGLIFIMIGAVIPLRENFLPKLIPAFSKEAICQKIEQSFEESDHSNQTESFLKFCNSVQSRAYYGIGIYPRYFLAGEGYYERKNDPWFGNQDYSRLVFRVIGKNNKKVFIKTNIKDIEFENGASVYVVDGNDSKGSMVVLIDSENPQLIISSDINKNDYVQFGFE